MILESLDFNFQEDYMNTPLRDPGAYFLKNRGSRCSAGAYFLKISDPRELIFRKFSPALRARSYFFK